MRKSLEDKWNKAFDTGEPVELGRDVVCDECTTDYTDSDAVGGLIFGSRAICPECAPKWLKRAEKYGEQHFIRASNAGTGKSFGDFVREYRGPDSAIQVHGDPVLRNILKGK